MMILVIGEKPSKKTKNNPTLKNLYRWLGYMDIKTVSFTNISDSEWMSVTNKYDVIIALGRKASDELNRFGIIHFMLPHPSPRNRQLNNKSFIKEQLDSCKAYLEGMDAILH